MPSVRSEEVGPSGEYFFASRFYIRPNGWAITESTAMYSPTYFYGDTIPVTRWVTLPFFPFPREQKRSRAWLTKDRQDEVVGDASFFPFPHEQKRSRAWLTKDRQNDVVGEVDFSQTSATIH
eukprot:scaffold22641_cov206-Cylindrotheca_fusiformis.AAC.7